MKRFDLIDHTADIGIIAYGKTLQDSFANAAFGLFSIITDVSSVKETELKRIEVNARDVEGLVVNWLNELVYVFDVDHMLFKRCDIKKLTDNYIQADCYGEQYNPSVHRLKLGVKSATYHMLQVDRTKNRIQVIFDV